MADVPKVYPCPLPNCRFELPHWSGRAEGAVSLAVMLPTGTALAISFMTGGRRG